MIYGEWRSTGSSRQDTGNDGAKPRPVLTGIRDSTHAHSHCNIIEGNPQLTEIMPGSASDPCRSNTARQRMRAFAGRFDQRFAGTYCSEKPKRVCPTRTL